MESRKDRWLDALPCTPACPNSLWFWWFSPFFIIPYGFYRLDACSNFLGISKDIMKIYGVFSLLSYYFKQMHILTEPHQN